jgi:H2-forming N5,N10-methylenetetrahydromethanopterin dehydrogenase-like enzyme
MTAYRSTRQHLYKVNCTVMCVCNDVYVQLRVCAIACVCNYVYVRLRVCDCVCVCRLNPSLIEF